MPFEIVQTQAKSTKPQAKITYLRGTRRGKASSGPPKLVISIPTTICGAAKAKLFVLLLGSGEDAGKIRIKGVEADGIAPTELRHAFVFRFGYVPRLGEDSFDGEHQPVTKISDDEYEISVPESWFEGE